jgi:hypothetical protein
MYIFSYESGEGDNTFKTLMGTIQNRSIGHVRTHI